MRRLAMAVAVLCLGALTWGANPSVPAPPNWQIEVVDGGSRNNVGLYPTLVVDQKDNLHVVYGQGVMGAGATLAYAYRPKTGGKWFTMKLGSGGPTSSLAVNSNGNPCVAYLFDGLRYAEFDGKKWSSQLIDPSNLAFFLSLQLDKDNHPRISYYHRLYPDGSYALRLKYAFFDGKTWYTQTVDPRLGMGKFNELALDSEGNPHIAYSDVEGFNLQYAHWNGENWVFGTPDTSKLSSGWVGTGTSITVDKSGSPYISYFEVNRRKLKVAHKVGEQWQREEVDTLVGNADRIELTSIKLDSHGIPHIAYYDGGLGALKYATKTDSGWQTEIVDDSGDAGMYPSLAFTKEDVPYIAYYDSTNGMVKVAHLSKATALPAAESAQQR